MYSDLRVARLGEVGVRVVLQARVLQRQSS